MNSFKIFIALLLVNLLCSLEVRSQFYNTGQDRASNKWFQIETEYFRLVFPDYAIVKAQSFANSLNWAIKNVPKGLSDKPTKIDIIMHMETSKANAYVSWAPKRMETYSLTDQSVYGQEWYEQLALHEYRHVVQIDKLNQGLSKILSTIFGEMVTGVILGAYLPIWYIEGDAVATETALSSTGRGRESNFEMPLKAQIKDYKIFSYDKATMGSYKDFVPDHYILGYHLTTFGKKYYGQDIWENTENYIARNPYNPIAFSHSLKRESGLNKKAFYNDIIQKLDSSWQKTSNLNDNVKVLVENTSKHNTSYKYAAMINDSMMFAVRYGINDRYRFITINTITGKQKRIMNLGISHFYNVSVEDSMICWTEKRYHPRWENVQYSVVMTYNFRTRKRKQLTHRTNYLFPVLDSKANRIFCIENSKNGDNSIIILDAKTGEIDKEIKIPLTIKNLSISNDNRYIYYYQLQKDGFELVEYNLSEDSQRIMLSASFENRNWLLSRGNHLYYSDDSSGVANLYVLDKSTLFHHQITDLPYGVHNISKYKNNLIFSSYSANGFMVAKLNIDSIKAITSNYSNKSDFYNSYITDSTRNIQTENISQKIFEVKKYSKFTHLLNTHSWGPLAIHAVSTEVNPGLSIMSQNLLSSLELSAGYEYILSENVGRIYTDISYNGWFPRIAFSASYQNRKSYNLTSNSYEYSWNETSMGIIVSQGLNLNKGVFKNYIRPLIGLNTIHLGENNDTPEGFPKNSNLISLRTGLYMLWYRGLANKDLGSRLGQSINLEYRATPFGDLDYGSTAMVESNFFLPGIGKHHNIKVYLGYQEKTTATYSYSNIVQLARGYIGIDGNKLQSYQFNYEMPLLYPDMSISSLIYLKRIKTKLFYDITISDVALTDNYGNIISPKPHYKSYGIDLRFDMHILRIFAPFDLGIRYAYLEIYKSNYFQFLFDISI